MTNIASGFALALHGGAGTLRCGEMTAEPGGLPGGLWRAHTDWPGFRPLARIEPTAISFGLPVDATGQM